MSPLLHQDILAPQYVQFPQKIYTGIAPPQASILDIVITGYFGKVPEEDNDSDATDVQGEEVDLFARKSENTGNQLEVEYSGREDWVSGKASTRRQDDVVRRRGRGIQEEFAGAPVPFLRDVLLRRADCSGGSLPLSLRLSTCPSTL